MLPPARTIRDVRALFPIAATVPMQRHGRCGRYEDTLALARGVEGFARAFAKLKPDWVVVLGDRIEAFAAASAASIAGIAVCHVHGGDRAEGIADEAMRHAITKLAHLHCAATELSARRIIKMGERAEHVHVTGSPAIDGLRDIKPMGKADARRLGDPRCVVLLHPIGDADADRAAAMLASCLAMTCGPGVFLAPNADPGREVIERQWEFMRRTNASTIVHHLPRPRFLSLLVRLARSKRGLIIGNSSAALIECAALGLPAIDIGRRQSGRERSSRVLWLPGNDVSGPALARAMQAAKRHLMRAVSRKVEHSFGDGRSARRIADLLARIDPADPNLIRKRIVY